MPEYIDIEDIPRTVRTTKYPWKEWAKMPRGQALEITDDLHCAPQSFVTNRVQSKRHNLILILRKDRVWVAKEKQP